jgi:DNA-directed RNA polymerase subunit RPC12/RpoP
VSANPTDAGPPPPTGAHPALTVLLACEACGEELLVAFPRGRARYGAIDCPGCGSRYLFLLEPRDGGKALSSASVA